MAYIKDVQVGSDTYLIEPTLYIAPTKNGAAYTATLTNFSLVTGATVQAKFAATNNENATLNVNSTGAKEIHYNGDKITANQFKVNHVYTLVYDGTQWQVVGDIDTNTNTWRGIQDNLTSDSTTDSLSAKQGKVLKGLIDAMDASTPAASGNATAFIDSITQTDGKITSITKKNIPTVSSSTAGLVPKGTAVSTQSTSTKFLREDGAWATPSYITNTDAKVAQSSNTEDKEFPIILKNTDNTTNETNGVKYDGDVTVNPSKSKITATTIQANSRLVASKAISQIITGTGTAGSYTNSTYHPAKWTFNTGLTATDGDIFTIKIPVAGHDYGVFMSVDNGSHYYPVVLNGTRRITTHYPVNTYLTVIFEPTGSAASMYAVAGQTSSTRITVTGGVWRVLNYYDSNSNDTGYYHRRIYPNLKAGTGSVDKYTIIMQLPNGRWSSIVQAPSWTTNSSGSVIPKDTGKSASANGFMLGHVLLMYANATYADGANIGTYNIWSAHTGLIDARYSFNLTSSAGFTAYTPVYIVGTVSDGLFHLDTTKWWTQTLPSSDDGKVYIYIGDAYDWYRITFTEDKPMYWYKNGAIRLYSGASEYALSAPLSGVSGADDLKAIEAISGTSGLLKKTAANTWTLDTNNYVTSSGITSITIGATSPVQSSTSTAQTGSSASTTISLKDAYGDTKNPYGAKAKNLVLAGPASGSNAAPSFRALVAADIPNSILKWQTTTTASTDLYDFGVYVNQNNAAGSSMTDGNYFNILNVPYRKASGNTKADWGWQLGNTTANDSRLWYRTAGDNTWGEWQTIAHATQSTSNIGSTTQPVYMTSNGTITPITTVGAAYGGTGKTTLIDSANVLINALSTGSSDLTANDYVITQYVGGGTTTTTYHRRPASKVVNATLVKAALGTDTSTTTQWLNKKGEWSTPTASQVGAITKLSSSTDNAIVRFDGTDGQIQNSKAKLDDTGNLLIANDASIKIYRQTNTTYGYETYAIQTCFDGQDPETSNYISTYELRCNLLLQPRGGQVYIGTDLTTTGDTNYSLYVTGDTYLKNTLVVKDIKPDATDTYSLGTANKRWNAYFAPKTIGGRNYIYSTPITGGRSRIEEKTVVFNPNANNGDSYFYVKAARDIPVGTYTFSMDCEGLGANEVWTFGIINQNSGKVISVKNGRSALTFEVTTAITAGTNIILDDIARPTTSTRVVFSNFMWEAATSPSDFSYAPEEIESTYVKRITSTKYGIAYYSDTTGTFAGTGAGTSGQYLKSNGNSAPTWATFSASTVGLGNVENTKLSTWAGSSNITTVGTISTGTWHGTKIANDYIANPKVTIAGNDISLGGSLTAATLTSSLGLSNALHFIGITSTTLTDGSTTATLAPKSTGSLSKTTGFVDGDVVMDSDQLREYVWSNSAWHLLGITTSTKYEKTTSGNTFISKVTQATDGTITAESRELNTSGTWSGNAATATALTSNAGGTEQPIYFSGGKPVATSYSLAASVGSGTKNFLSKYTDIHSIGSSTICNISNIDYRVITPNYTSGGEQYYKALLAYICNNYSTADIYIGTANPNSKGPILGNIYSVEDKDSTTNLPRYSTFWFNNLKGSLEVFGTHSYNYYHYTYLNDSNYTDYAYALDGSNTGTKLQISTQSAAYTNGIQFMYNTTKKGSIGTDSSGIIGIYGTKIVLRPQLDASTKGVEVTTDAMYPTAAMTLGSTSARWAKLYIGNANNHGDAYTPVYWNDGVPTAVTPIQYCEFTIGSGKKGVKLTHAAFTAASYVTQIVIIDGESNLNSTIAWESAAGYINLTCSATSGAVTGYILVSRGGAVTATATDIT